VTRKLYEKLPINLFFPGEGEAPLRHTIARPEKLPNTRFFAAEYVSQAIPSEEGAGGLRATLEHQRISTVGISFGPIATNHASTHPTHPRPQ
jgi:hypothetical protein